MKPAVVDPSFSWFVPIDGDGPQLGTDRAERAPTLNYLTDVVLTAERCGYRSLLIPTRFANGSFEESAPLAETWTTVSMLAARTETIRFLVAVRPGFVAPGLFAQQAATLAWHSGGRLDLNVVPGGIQGDFERFGVTLDHEARYALATEWIDAMRALWAADAPVDFAGEHVTLRGALVSPSPGDASPEIYTGGASDSALRLAAGKADVLLAWIQPLEALGELQARARAAFDQAGREARFGLRTHVVVADTEAAAWREAEAVIAAASPEVIAQRAAQVAGTAMVGAAAQAAPSQDHRVGARLWNGISTVRVNCGTAIVGTPDQVADEIAGYGRAGFGEFILSGFPHLETCEQVAAEVVPRVRDRLS